MQEQTANIVPFARSYAARAGLAEAWITNGLHTAHIPAAAFGLFERDGP
jgi:hypothetical protein